MPQRGLRVSKANSPLVVEVGAHAPEQSLLVVVRQEELEGVARQEDEPEPLVEVERARVALDPARGHAGGLGLAARHLQHARDDVQTGHGEPLPRDGEGDPARAAGDLEHRAAGLPRERRVEGDSRVAAVPPVVADRIGELLQVVVVDQRPPPERRDYGPASRGVAPTVPLPPDHRSTARPAPASASPSVGRAHKARYGPDHPKFGRAKVQDA